MAGIDFITSNPATDAYQKAERLRRESDLSDLKLATGETELDERRLTQPTRLRRMEADTSLSETRAQTARDEAPYAAPRAAAGLRSATAGALRSENAWFKESLDRLDKGDVEGARQLASLYKQEIPDEAINSAEFRKTLRDAEDYAEKTYKGRPKDRANYFARAVEDYKQKKAAGIRIDPSAPYTVPGAPEPQETATTFANRFEPLARTEVGPDGKPVTGTVSFDRSSGTYGDFQPGEVRKLSGSGGGASGRKITGTEAIINELRAENPALSYQDALAIAKRSGQSVDALTLRKEAIALSAAKSDVNFLTNPDATIEKYRSKYGLGAAAPGPGPQSGVVRPPAPSPQMPSQMSPGDGGKPLNIQVPPLPPNLPTGLQYQYSPSRRQLRDELGRTYDINGNLVG